MAPIEPENNASPTPDGPPPGVQFGKILDTRTLYEYGGAITAVWTISVTFGYVFAFNPKWLPLLIAELIMIVAVISKRSKRIEEYIVALVNGALIFTASLGVNTLNNYGPTNTASKSSFIPFDNYVWFPPRKLEDEKLALQQGSKDLARNASDQLTAIAGSILEIQENASNPTVKNVSGNVLDQIRSSQTNLNKDLTALQEQKTPSSKQVLSTVTDFESDGFKMLLERNLGGAVADFGNAEQVAPTYHNVAEIGRLLRPKIGNLEPSDDVAWTAIYSEILTKYSWGMPSDVRAQFVSAVNSPSISRFKWALPIQQDDNLDDAKYHLQNMLGDKGFSNGYIFFRQGDKYRTARLFTTQEEAKQFLPMARRLEKTVDVPELLESFCKGPRWSPQGYFVCSN